MCLYVDIDVTASLKHSMGEKKVLLWKVLQLDRTKNLISPYYPLTWKTGVTVAIPTSKHQVQRLVIGLGIHVYTNPTRATVGLDSLSSGGFPQSRHNYNDIYTIARVECEGQHLLGANMEGEAVFSQVTMHECDLQSAIQSAERKAERSFRQAELQKEKLGLNPGPSLKRRSKWKEIKNTTQPSEDVLTSNQKVPTSTWMDTPCEVSSSEKDGITHSEMAGCGS